MKDTTVLHRSSVRLGLAALAVATVVPSTAHAQVAGTSGRPLPNVLLLVDNSGSMERVPSTGNTPVSCVPGTAANADSINRWAMLLQALTGNFQPYYSCEKLNRTGDPFVSRYRIGGIGSAGKDPYDKDYFLPYHQPVTGSGADACVITPWHLPGAAPGSGVGPNGLGYSSASIHADSYPDDAMIAYKRALLGNGVVDTTISDSDSRRCIFDQSNDGQLDVSTQYARFALMTFDSLVEKETGITGSLGAWQVNTADPFKGNWSYLRHSGNEFWGAPHSDGDGAALGAPPACGLTVQEVGSRNAGAPPWEGRLIRFANPDASIYDLAAQNQLIQQTLLATRPFGATPIDGMMDDARDYLFNDPEGPGSTVAPWNDPYTCRDKYIILLTDGAPNLDLRPSCAMSGSFPNITCPYPRTAGDIADQMFMHPPSEDKKVTTFVIGFSVNGVNVSGTNDDGFPHTLPEKNCKSWFNDAALGGGGNPTTMKNVCEATPPPAGSTGEACCTLNKIALQGSGQGAFFAESQADVVLAFGRIMANIIHSASTKALPAFSPLSASSGYGAVDPTKSSSAEFVASYVPASQTPWAGELDRTRFKCDATNTSVPDPPVPDPVAQAAVGDFESQNLAAQTTNNKRIFISVKGDTIGAGTDIDSSASIRPFVSATSSTQGDTIGIPGSTAGSTPPYKATEVVMRSYDDPLPADWARALNITKNTCKRGRAVAGGLGTGGIGTNIIPALDLDDGTNCTKVVWGFTTSTPRPLSFSGTPASAGSYEFNIRCKGGGSSTEGTCSISGGACTPQNSTCGVGETCIPKCGALGAIYHGSPTVVGPPSTTLREDGYRQYQKAKAKRRSVLYAASTDGILHAFDALRLAAPTKTHELWSFVPPAVLPHLASNYPGGNQILLDGAPVVRDIVWDRKTTDAPNGSQWHSVLVAGIGTYPGYYALNVTDADCGSADDDACITHYAPPAYGSADDVSNSGDTSGTPKGKTGPHFLWQLTDVPANNDASETAITRTTTIGKMAGLFGKNTGTPAVGMATIKTADSTNHQIGIAVLPGGYDNPPFPGSCPRHSQPGGIDMTDAESKPRLSVRQWAKGGCGSPVTGRNVTIVRADTGEVLRIFGRTMDVPIRLRDKLAGTGYAESFLDSPMVGTPVLYPDTPGVPVQKIFIGDADGALWKIDVTSTNPKDWKIYLFADLLSHESGAPDAVSQPVAVPPVLSTSDDGSLIVNATTGDQESIIYNASLKNYVWSLRDSNAKVTTLWYRALTNERVTGPMTVFDKTLYFASFSPGRPSGTGSAACNNLGNSYLWGLHYTIPETDVASGGRKAWCPDMAADGANCSAGLKDKDPPATGKNDIIPGVVLHQAQSCVASSGTDEWGNTAFSQTSTSSFSLYFGIARPMGAGAQTQAARSQTARPMPKVSTQISSWSLVVE